MSTQNQTNSESVGESPFFSDLMQHLMQGTMIPKVQVERAVGPIIGFFLADALATNPGDDIVMLCPEFPIQKADNKQSTNIDWLMFNHATQTLLLVELKTTDTTYRPEQAKIYHDLQEKIGNMGSAAFLLDDLQAIGEASLEEGKYKHVRRMMVQGLRLKDEGTLRETLNGCQRAKVIYLAPQVSKPADWPDDDAGRTWLSFAALPETLDAHPHADQWPILRNSLLSLDSLTRRLRNGDEESVAGTKNYLDVLGWEALLLRCAKEGNVWVVGLQNWREALPNMTLAQLRAKTYKCDRTEGRVGKKICSNWIAGDQLLAHVAKLLD